MLQVTLIALFLIAAGLVVALIGYDCFNSAGTGVPKASACASWLDFNTGILSSLSSIAIAFSLFALFLTALLGYSQLRHGWDATSLDIRLKLKDLLDNLHKRTDQNPELRHYIFGAVESEDGVDDQNLQNQGKPFFRDLISVLEEAYIAYDRGILNKDQFSHYREAAKDWFENDKFRDSWEHYRDATYPRFRKFMNKVQEEARKCSTATR